jgi:16S rRNA (uracil1498-N3)-methyltransferase
LTANHFFVDRRNVDKRRARLTGDEHHHLSRVVRMTVGDDVWLFDDRGMTYRARVEAITPEETRLAILEQQGPRTRLFRITLGQALLKAKGMELVIQKATEIGVYAIAPIETARSVVQAGHREAKTNDRWMKIVLAASKQSHSGLLPRIFAPRALKDFLGDPPGPVTLALSERGGRPLREIVLGTGKEPPADVRILVGPEGGWTTSEERLILEAGAITVSLGGNVLRAETAALAAVAILTHFWSD